MKTCAHCKTEKTEDNFRPMARKGKNAKYLHSYCSGCESSRAREVGFDARRKWNLQKKYGITVEQYGVMLGMQEGCCAICAQPETQTMNGRPVTLAVDHDHETGKVRKLLCKACNTAIGLLGEDTARIDKARQYLEAHA
jgi:hypothetical protein